MSLKERRVSLPFLTGSLGTALSSRGCDICLFANGRNRTKAAGSSSRGCGCPDRAATQNDEVRQRRRIKFGTLLESRGNKKTQFFLVLGKVSRQFNPGLRTDAVVRRLGRLLLQLAGKIFVPQRPAGHFAESHIQSSAAWPQLVSLSKVNRTNLLRAYAAHA